MQIAINHCTVYNIVHVQQKNRQFKTWIIGGVHTGMPNRFRIGLKPIWRVHTEIGLAQTDLDPTHLTMWVETGLALARNAEKMAATWTDAETM